MCHDVGLLSVPGKGDLSIASGILSHMGILARSGAFSKSLLKPKWEKDLFLTNELHTVL